MLAEWTNYRGRPLFIVNGRPLRHYGESSLSYTEPSDAEMGECLLSIDGTVWSISDNPHLHVEERRSGRLLIRLENMRMIAYWTREINPIPMERL